MTQKTKTSLTTIVMFLSLLGNMFFIGLWVGSPFQYTTDTSSVTYESDYQAVQIKDLDTELREQLPSQDKQLLRSQMKEVKNKFEKQKNAVREARRAVRKAMYAEPFDQAALDDALKSERAAKQDMYTLINSTRRKMAKELSPKGRKALAKIEDRALNFKPRDKDKRMQDRSRLQKYKEMRERRKNAEH